MLQRTPAAAAPGAALRRALFACPPRSSLYPAGPPQASFFCNLPSFLFSGSSTNQSRTEHRAPFPGPVAPRLGARRGRGPLLVPVPPPSPQLGPPRMIRCGGALGRRWNCTFWNTGCKLPASPRRVSRSSPTASSNLPSCLPRPGERKRVWGEGIGGRMVPAPGQTKRRTPGGRSAKQLHRSPTPRDLCHPPASDKATPVLSSWGSLPPRFPPPHCASNCCHQHSTLPPFSVPSLRY